MFSQKKKTKKDFATVLTLGTLKLCLTLTLLVSTDLK